MNNKVASDNFTHLLDEDVVATERIPPSDNPVGKSNMIPLAVIVNAGLDVVNLPQRLPINPTVKLPTALDRSIREIRCLTK